MSSAQNGRRTVLAQSSMDEELGRKDKHHRGGLKLQLYGENGFIGKTSGGNSPVLMSSMPSSDPVYYDKNIKTKPLINGIGYKELYNYFDGLCSKEEAVEKIKQNSRHYAKRQYTFLNHQMNVHWITTNYEDFNKTVLEAYNYIKEKN